MDGGSVVTLFLLLKCLKIHPKNGRHTVQKKLTGRHNLPQTCAPWRIFIRKLTNFVTFFSWLFDPNFLKPLKYFGGFMTNHVNLFNFVFSKKWQNLLLFWKSMVELVLAKKTFLWLMWELNRRYLGLRILNLTYPILTYTYRSAP